MQEVLKHWFPWDKNKSQVTFPTDIAWPYWSANLELYAKEPQAITNISPKRYARDSKYFFTYINISYTLPYSQVFHSGIFLQIQNENVTFLMLKTM
jgi:hypothetical protein